jgi:hypothetical protein
MSNERILENSQLLKLRELNTIGSDEVAIQAGDIFYAKNVLTSEKRIISIPREVFSSNESVAKNENTRLLKG